MQSGFEVRINAECWIDNFTEDRKDSNDRYKVQEIIIQ